MTNPEVVHEVVVIGAGLAGLACALHLEEAGLRPLVLEASDRPGGRVRTDEVDGFLLDRGFQVFLTSYPEARRILDYDALDLRPFHAGAMVRLQGGFTTVADPRRHPLEGVGSAFSSLGSPADKLRILAFQRRLKKLERGGPSSSRAIDEIRAAGFSRRMIDGFFRPFLGGVFLERELETSSAMLAFVWRMFSSGRATLPARGMEAIPAQLAARLRDGELRVGSPVESVSLGEPGLVRLESGETIRARSIVVSTADERAAAWLARPTPGEWRSVSCFYFDAERSPVDTPWLVLDGEGRGPVNNLCVPSLVSPHYAPAGRHLVSATVLDRIEEGDDVLLPLIREQLAGWYGPEVLRWRHLRSYRIPRALPVQPEGLSGGEFDAQVAPGLYACGDITATASIQGAFLSGRRAAEQVLARRSTGALSG